MKIETCNVVYRPLEVNALRVNLSIEDAVEQYNMLEEQLLLLLSKPFTLHLAGFQRATLDCYNGKHLSFCHEDYLVDTGIGTPNVYTEAEFAANFKVKDLSPFDSDDTVNVHDPEYINDLEEINKLRDELRERVSIQDSRNLAKRTIGLVHRLDIENEG